MNEFTKFDYSKMISINRNTNNITKAIEVAQEARESYPDENIFEKFLGDLYFQQEEYENAGVAYINFLTKIRDDIQYTKHFAHFLERYASVASEKQIKEYIKKAEIQLDEKVANKNVVSEVCEILSRYIDFPNLEVFTNDYHFKAAVKYMNNIQQSCQLYILYYKILRLEHSEKNKQIDKYVVSSMEKNEQFKQALYLISNVLEYDDDQVAVRTLFRICRKLEDYSVAEKYIVDHPEIQKLEKFNILYELVYYYSKKGNIEERNSVLKKIEKCGHDSIPIKRTLYNFYLQFGLLDQAAAVIKQIEQLKDSTIKKKENSDRKQQEVDSEKALFDTIKDMFEELQHSRKLISMSEILKGFSHELGQPVTNIRYSIQLYQMKMEKGVNTELELQDLFGDILSQTYRIKRLLSRFSPIVTEKDNLTDFSVEKEIKSVFEEFSSRLAKENIEWKINIQKDFSLYGDHVKFAQIFYNLIGNAIYSIHEKAVPGCITVNITEKSDTYSISFQDNGTGVATEYIDKLFEPFFTTKEQSDSENGGGEGLGLYIIWNIVQMFNGRIKLDKTYRQGARFLIDILKKESERGKNE